jgi:hypothetical protein
VVICAWDVVRWDTMPMVVARGTPRILQASSTIMDRGRPHSSNNPGIITRNRRATRASRTTSAGVWITWPWKLLRRLRMLCSVCS